MSTAAVPTRYTPSFVALHAWRETFALDVRALVAVRIGVAVMLLIDLFFRSFDLTAHYTDAGVLPRAARMGLIWDYSEPWWMSLHMLHGSWHWNAMLFVIAALAAVSLLVGYRTKLALFVSWLLMLSLHARFPMLLQGGDVLLRCLLFWLLFLPLDSCLSCQRSSDTTPMRGSIFSLATVAVLSQLLIMYLFTALLKTSPLWTANFHATYYALHIDHFTKPLGYALLEYPRLLQLLTASALLLEFAGPLLLLLPFGQRYLRIALPLTFIGFHAGLALCLDLGTFPWICMLYWLLFLPTPVWDWCETLVAKIGLVRCVDQNASFISAPHSGSYEKISAHASWSTNLIAGFFLVYVLLTNLERLRNPAATVGRFPLNMVGKVTGLEQYWNMFSPGPYEYGSWLRVEGTKTDGSLVNLVHPTEPLAYEKPRNVSATYSSQYWRRCFVTAYEFEEPLQQTALLQYFATEWNRTHAVEDRVIVAQFVHMVQPTPPPFSNTISPVARRELRTLIID